MTTPDAAVVRGAAPPFPVDPASIPGLSSCLEEGRLSAGGMPAQTTICDLDALRLVEHAFAATRSILICPPDPLTSLAALIPAAAHLASLVAGYRDSGSSVGSKLHIAVVTTDYHLRGLYRGLAIRPRPGAMAEPLRAVVPAGALGVGGRLHVLDESARGWATVFVRTLDDLRLVGPVDMVVVELPVADPQRLAGLAVPVVLVARDPADPIARELSATMPSFAWEPAAAISAGSFSVRLFNRNSGSVEIVPVDSPSVTGNAALFWDDIGALSRAGRAGLGRELAREAFALFHDLLGLAMPIDVYERSEAGSVSARLSALGRACTLLDRGELRELYLPMVEAELDALADAVRASDAKPVVLPTLLADAVDDHRDVLLVTRTAGLARAYTTYLADVRLEQVRVCSLGELVETVPADVAVLTGMAPTWGRWVYRSGIAPSMRILAYTDGALDPTGSDSRFDEARLVARALEIQSIGEAALTTPARREWSWRKLKHGSDDPPPDAQGNARPVATPIADVPPPPEAPIGLWEHGRWLADLEPPARGIDDRASSVPVDRVIRGLQVELDDGTRVLLAADAHVSRWRAVAGRVQQVPANDLRVDDQLIFLDEDAHKTLLAKVVEVAESVPALAVAGGWLRHWRAVLLAAYQDAGSYNRLATRLARHGCHVQAQTVRLWVVGETMGPEDPQDVHRLGLVTSDPVLLAAHAEVHRAMRTLRGAHVRLGRRLAEITRRTGAAAASGALVGDELVDETSGLTAADVESAVSIATVRGITDIGDIPAVLTGRRTTGGDLP